MATSRVRLDARAFFWSVAVVTFFAQQLTIWMMLGRVRRFGKRLWILLFHPWGTRRSVLLALLAASALTLIADLLVRWVVAPLVARWHSPAVDTSQLVFLMAPGEEIMRSTPARRACGGRWLPGTLYRTKHLVGFAPAAWDAEPWVRPLTSIVDVQLQPSRRLRWEVMKDWPARVAVRVGAEDPVVFAVPDPEAVALGLQRQRLTATPAPGRA